MNARIDKMGRLDLSQIRARIHLRANEKWKGEKSASVTLRCPLQPSWEGAAGSCLSAPPPPHIETAMLIVQCASAQCDLCIGTQLCIERSDTAVAGTVRRSAHSSVTVDPGGSAAGTSHHQHHPLSSTITIIQLFLTASHITWCTIARKECNMLFAPICHT